MTEIRTTKIDGVEFVTYKDYLRLKEENEKLQEEIKNHKQNIMQDELEIIPKLEEENKAVGILSDEIRRINKNLREENKELKEKLEQIKETYIRFEDSEKEYNKRLGELDQLIMNR